MVAHLSRLCWFVLFLASLTSCRSTVSRPQEAELPPGAPMSDSLRYIGFAQSSQGASKIASILDLVKTKGDLNTTKYAGVLRLALGGFAGREYTSLYFSNISFDHQTKVLALGGGPEGINVSLQTFSPQLLRANISSVSDKTNLVLEMKPESESSAITIADEIFPQSTVMRPITGNYSANCPGQMTTLQIEASKWRKSTGGPPFADIRLIGRSGKPDEELCGKNQVCVKESFSSGVITPAASKVTLSNATLTRSCSINGQQLVCDGCVITYDPISHHALLDYTANYGRHKRPNHLPPPLSDDTNGASPPRGEYFGFLHHEQSNSFQLIALDLHTTQSMHTVHAPLPTATQLEAIATVYFGEGDSNEFITYHFKPFTYEGQGQIPLVLDGDSEALVVLDSVRNDRLSGIWYGKTYGRVGTVELQLGSVPPLPIGSHLIEKVSGLYKSKDSEFEVLTTANLSEDAGDFYPLKVVGWARDPEEKSRRRNIVDGSFDFYTNSYAFRLDDGRMLIGSYTPTGLALHWPTKPRYGAPLTGSTQLFKVSR